MPVSSRNFETEKGYEQCRFTISGSWDSGYEAGERCGNVVKNPDWPYGHYVGWLPLCRIHHEMVAKFLACDAMTPEQRETQLGRVFD